MRPTAQTQSAFRTPLNSILGTEARVRILRVLATAMMPVSSGDIARQAKLQPSGVRRTLAELTDYGIVEAVGGGSRHLFQLRRGHPHVGPIIGLFTAETARFDELLAALRQAVAHALPLPTVKAVWAQGPIVAGLDRRGDPLTIGVLGSASTIDNAASALRTALAPLQQSQDITIEVRPFTDADIATLSSADRAALDDAIPLIGATPVWPNNPTGSTSLVDARRARNTWAHGDVDARLLALAGGIADKLRRDPTIVPRTRRYIDRRMPQASESERLTLREWEEILTTMSIPQLRRLLVDPGPRATRLCQSLPFLDVLSPRERETLMRMP